MEQTSPEVAQRFDNAVKQIDGKGHCVVKCTSDQQQKIITSLIARHSADLLNFSRLDQIRGKEKGDPVIIIDCSTLPEVKLKPYMWHKDLDETAFKTQLSLSLSLLEEVLIDHQEWGIHRPKKITAMETIRQKIQFLKRKVIDPIRVPDLASVQIGFNLEDVIREMKLSRLTIVLSNFDSISSEIQPDILEEIILNMPHFGVRNLKIKVLYQGSVNELRFGDRNEEIGLPLHGGHASNLDLTEPAK